MNRRFTLTLLSLILVITLVAAPVLASAGVFDDFNRPDGALGPNWTDRSNAMEISNMKAQAASTWAWSAATYNGGTGTILEGDVQYHGDEATFIGFLLNYQDNDNNLLIKVQDNFDTGGFNSIFCLYGPWMNESSIKMYEYFSDDPFTSAHMQVKLVEDTAFITFSNIDGGGESRTYVWENVPTTGGTGVGITGLKGGTDGATMDNFSVDNYTASSKPPNWNKGNKKGWDGSAPPGLDKQDKTPSGFDKGNKTGWDKTND